MMKVVTISAAGEVQTLEYSPTQFVDGEKYWKDCLDDPSVLVAAMLFATTHESWDVVKTFIR